MAADPVRQYAGAGRSGFKPSLWGLDVAEKYQVVLKAASVAALTRAMPPMRAGVGSEGGKGDIVLGGEGFRLASRGGVDGQIFTLWKCALCNICRASENGDAGQIDTI